MKIAHETRDFENSNDFVDIDTIRRRVAMIKSRWTPEVARARASEGARRRSEFDRLVTALLLEANESCEESQDTHGLSLVG